MKRARARGLRRPRRTSAAAAARGLAVAAAQITVMTSGGFTAPLLDVIPHFERATNAHDRHRVRRVDRRRAGLDPGQAGAWRAGRRGYRHG